jgi:CheY-like chemotaxis protein
MASRPKVLVVDDSPTTCLFIASTLEQAGYDVQVALEGQECLARMMKFQPDCLILDVMLPDMTGYAVCRYIQQNMLGKAVYTILISTRNGALDQSYGLRQGADRYLPKPFSAETLVRAVWEGVPPRLRFSVRPSLPSAPQKHMQPALDELIPCRVDRQGTMRTSTPFAAAPAIADKQARRLYEAIDGKRTLGELVAVVGMNAEAAARPLRVLLNEHHIRMYDAAGRPVEDALPVH